MVIKEYRRSPEEATYNRYMCKPLQQILPSAATTVVYLYLTMNYTSRWLYNSIESTQYLQQLQKSCSV